MSTKSSNPQIVGTSPEQRVVAIPAMVWICRPDGSAESFCGQWHALLGQTTAEAVGWGWVNVIHPLERRQVLDAWKDAVSSGRDCEIETRLKMANGEYRRHVITATPVRDALGDIQNWCSVCKDVDGEIQYEHWERSETQRELAKEKAVLQAIVNGLPDAVLLGDLERRLTFCNPGAYQMFGYEDGELVGKFGLDLLANEADKVDYAATIFHREAPRKFRTTEAEWLRKNGEKFLGEMVGTVIQNEAGAPIGYLALLRDITNRRQAELALRKREQHYRTVVETAGCVVAFMSAENKILEWNWEAERLLGYSLAEVVGRDPFDFLIDADRRENTEAVVDGVNAGTALTSFELPLRTRDGRQVILLWNATRVSDENGQLLGYFAVGQDITELKATQGKLLQSERLAGMGQMMSSIAHESRNALQRIQAAVDMLKFEIPDHSEAARDLAEIASGRRDLMTLLDGMRDFAAPVLLDLQECTLSHVWQQAWRHLAGLRGSRQIELVEQIQGVDLRCTIDTFRIQQVFRNLMENMFAACADPVRITISCADDELQRVPAMRVTVRDNGPGLNAEQQKRIFDAFYTTKPKGTGLGMAIALKNVRAHRGTLDVGRGEQHGAEFIITLPREQTGGSSVAALPDRN